MNQIIPSSTLEHLRSQSVTLDTCRKVLKLLIKGDKTEDRTECEVYTVLQILLASNYSLNKIVEVLNNIGFPEEFSHDFQNAFHSLPKIRAGNALDRLVDVNWKTVHEVSTSGIRKLHAPAIVVKPVVQDLKGEFEEFAFTCTRAQLADLVYKLKAAVQQIEKIY
jgi:hypothetical protein